MPEISRFLGIVITMYFNDHNPPHFHVRLRLTVSLSALHRWFEENCHDLGD